MQGGVKAWLFASKDEKDAIHAGSVILAVESTLAQDGGTSSDTYKSQEDWHCGTMDGRTHVGLGTVAVTVTSVRAFV